MYKELLYWEKKFKKRQGRLRILGSRWVVRPFPAPTAPGLAPAGSCRAEPGREQPHTLAWKEDQRNRREGKWWERSGGSRGRSQAACTGLLPSQAAWGWLAKPTRQGPESWPLVSLKQAWPPAPPGGLAWSQGPSAQEDDWDGTPTRPWAQLIPGVAKREDSTVKSEATGRPFSRPLPAFPGCCRPNTRYLGTDALPVQTSRVHQASS